MRNNAKLQGLVVILSFLCILQFIICNTLMSELITLNDQVSQLDSSYAIALHNLDEAAFDEEGEPLYNLACGDKISIQAMTFGALSASYDGTVSFAGRLSPEAIWSVVATVCQVNDQARIHFGQSFALFNEAVGGFLNCGRGGECTIEERSPTMFAFDKYDSKSTHEHVVERDRMVLRRVLSDQVVVRGSGSGAVCEEVENLARAAVSIFIMAG